MSKSLVPQEFAGADCRLLEAQHRNDGGGDQGGRGAGGR